MTKIKISGLVVSEPQFSHESYGEDFYEFQLDSERTSGTNDVVNVLVPKGLVWKIVIGTEIEVCGEIRTYNKCRKTKLMVFAETILEHYGSDENIVEIIGYVCQEPTFRTTPLGRHITDLLIASNRLHNASDYIPCIAWGRFAYESAEYKVGQKVVIVGRLQSRDYLKRLEDGNSEVRTTYEVSAKHISCYREEDDASKNNDDC